jgi:hypothetical protein
MSAVSTSLPALLLQQLDTLPILKFSFTKYYQSKGLLQLVQQVVVKHYWCNLYCRRYKLLIIRVLMLLTLLHAEKYRKMLQDTDTKCSYLYKCSVFCWQFCSFGIKMPLTLPSIICYNKWSVSRIKKAWLHISRMSHHTWHKSDKSHVT